MTWHPAFVLDHNFNPFTALAETLHQLKGALRIRQTTKRAHVFALFAQIDAFPAHVEVSLDDPQFPSQLQPGQRDETVLGRRAMPSQAHCSIRTSRPDGGILQDLEALM